MKDCLIFAAIASLLTVVSLAAVETPLPAVSPPTATPKGLSDSDWSGIRGEYEKHRHAIVANPDGSHLARNPGQAWLTMFDGRGFTVMPDAGGWTWGLELIGYGERTFVSDQNAARANKSVRPHHPEVRHEGVKVSYVWDDNLTEWFLNDTRGLEQGWTFQHRPERADPSDSLTLYLAVRGGLRPVVTNDRATVAFLSEYGGTAITYGGLKAWDADGKPVRARFADGEPADGSFCVEVDDMDARYPVTIDPIAQQAYLKASNTGKNGFHSWRQHFHGWDRPPPGLRGRSGGASWSK